MPAYPTKPSLIEALNKLNETPAIATCEDTSIPMPASRFVVDHCLATHAARSKEGFVFIPDESIYQTHAILRSANTAWQHDKLPVLAVCAFSKSPIPFQKETGIQADTADQFLSDLKLAHRIVPTIGATPAYIVRHYHSPNHRYDDVILPSHANLVVYQPHALSPTQLTSIFEHVANVRGKVILCDDRSAFANSYPELDEAVDRSLSKSIPRDLRRNLEPAKPTDDNEKLHINADKPFTFPNQSEHFPASESLRTNHHSPSDPPPARTPYLIYHAKTENPAEFPNGYVLVAKIQAEDIYRALADSHYSAAPWTENPGVVAFTRNARSTRPGDIICHNDEVKRLGVDDVAKITLLDSPLDRFQKEKFAADNPAPEAPESDRPPRKFKP